MLKNFFISMLGAIAGFWISLMLLIVVGMAMIISTAASALVDSTAGVSVKDNSIMEICLDSQIEEYPSSKSIEEVFNRQPASQTLQNILRAIEAAKADDRIKGIYLKCEGASSGFATRQAIMNALLDFKQSGKWILAYGDSYTQGDYYLATAANYLFLNPSGEVDVRGFSTTIPFFKGLLDKVGVQMQVFKVGTYKSAVEPFILDNMSDANREMTQYFLNNLWGEFAGKIAENRGVKIETVNQWADSLVVFDSAKSLVDAKIVDSLKYIDEVEKELKNLTGVDEDDDLAMVDYADYLSVADLPHSKKNKNKIAVYYACGDISDTGTTGITAEQVVPDILELAKDDDIDALILRVNSGGGSAFASEQIWHALEVFKAKGKTLYVSMGDYAASGGYYISCGAEKIYAEPTTLTGSIGIFGMLPCAKELANDKLGVNFGTVNTNANSDFPSIMNLATPFQARKMQSAINRGYDLFTSRCAAGRHISQDSIKAIGEGRVWDGKTAKRIGLVDQLGGLQDAISDLAKTKGYKTYQIVSYPNPDKTFWDFLADMPTQMKANALREELGSTYPIYLEIKRLENMEPVQARMMPMTLN
jgi:protease-4